MLATPCLSHHNPGVPLVPPSTPQTPLPTPQNSLQIHLWQSLQPPNLCRLGFLCCSFGFLNFSREDSPPSLQYTEFPEISHEVSWHFTCPMPSSIILVVKYSLQHCIQNLCPHSRPVKYCNDKEHKTLHHFITWIHSIISSFLVLCSSSIPSLIPHTKLETLLFILHHHHFRTLPGQSLFQNQTLIPNPSSKKRCGPCFHPAH